MPIRLLDRSSRLGRVNTALSPVTPAFSGTFTPAAARTGAISAQLSTVNAVFSGVAQTTSARTGTLSTALANVSAALIGTRTLPSGSGFGISSYSGVVANGSVVQILGAQFGSSGPNIVIFDDFDAPAANVGDPIPLTSPKVGQWSQYGHPTGRPRYNNVANSGTRGFRLSDPYWTGTYNPASLTIDNGNRVGQFLQLFGGPVTELFLCYHAIVPPNTTFPGSNSSTSYRTFPTASSWKFFWPYDGDSGFGGDGKADMCLPTHIGSGQFWLAGNDGNLVQLSNPSNWWAWDIYNRFAIWLRGNANPASNGNILFQTTNTQKGTVKQTWNDRRVFPAGATTSWDRMTVPGWWGNGNDESNNQIAYDDIYIATGPNACARVEIGDNPVYTSCGKLAICTPTSWADGSITATVRGGSFTNFSGAYFFVTDKDNNTTAGYPIS